MTYKVIHRNFLWRLTELSKGGRNSKCFVAKHNQCSIELLIKLSEDKDHTVRCAAINNPNCPQNIIKNTFSEAINNIDIPMLEALAANENTPLDIIVKISEIAKEKDNFDLAASLISNKNSPLNALINLIDINHIFHNRKINVNHPNFPNDLKYLSKEDLSKIVNNFELLKSFI